MTRPIPLATFVLLLGLPGASGAQQAAQDPAIREVQYNPMRVIDVAVARGVATLISLPAGESIRYVAAGRASDCAKAEDAWCVNGPEGTNLVFVKARSNASKSNNLEVVTTARQYSFRLNVAADEARNVTQRLLVRLAPMGSAASPMLAPVALGSHAGMAVAAASVSGAPVRVRASGREPLPVVGDATAARLDERLSHAPEIANTQYSIAVGERSDDIVPAAIFDDGRFTYLRLPGNREIPAVFHVTAEDEETVVNTRMEGDLLVVDRVSRKLRLRVGNQVVSVFNDAFDLEGNPPNGGMTVPGVERVVRAPIHGALP